MSLHMLEKLGSVFALNRMAITSVAFTDNLVCGAYGPQHVSGDDLLLSREIYAFSFPCFYFCSYSFKVHYFSPTDFLPPSVFENSSIFTFI